MCTGQHTASDSPGRNLAIQDLDSRPGGGAHRNSPDLRMCMHVHSTQVCEYRQTHACMLTLTYVCTHAHSSKLPLKLPISLQCPWQNPNSANYIRPTFHPSHQLQLALYLDFLLLWGRGEKPAAPSTQPRKCWFQRCLKQPSPCFLGLQADMKAEQPFQGALGITPPVWPTVFSPQLHPH